METGPDPNDLISILTQLYGKPNWKPRFEPMSELISCILSQNTSDTNSFPAFERMMLHYKTWDAISNAPLEELADVIRKAGLANQKAKHIKATLAEILSRRGEYDIEFLRKLPDEEAREWLISLPGIGPKCAAITLMMSMGKPVLPVDTHVFRIGWRLGYINQNISAVKAHDVLGIIVPKEIAYDFHVLLLTHGRNICKALNPLCMKCPLASMCWYYKEIVSKIVKSDS